VEKHGIAGEIVRRRMAIEKGAVTIPDSYWPGPICGHPFSKVSFNNLNNLQHINIFFPFYRRLELLARSGRFTDAAAVLQETSASSPEEAAIICEVVRDLKQNSPEKVEEFAKSIIAWLETVCKASIQNTP
jgi:hypothetical protein